MNDNKRQIQLDVCQAQISMPWVIIKSIGVLHAIHEHANGLTYSFRSFLYNASNVLRSALANTVNVLENEH
jgi:hypothetical protein